MRGVSPLASYVIQTAVTLVGLGVVAALLVVGARRTGVSKKNTGAMEIVDRLALEPRRSVYLVRIASKTYILGSSETGLVNLGSVEEAIAPEPADVR